MTQRFLSQDPIGFAAGDFNFYRYVGNSPVGFRDPLGLDPRLNGKVGMNMGADFEVYHPNTQRSQYILPDPITENIVPSCSNGTFYEKSGKPVEFEYGRFPFNDISTVENITQKSWPWGRVAAKISGTMTVDENGEYYVEGSASLQDDFYSWGEDGNNFFHNTGIRVLGTNFNSPYEGDFVMNSPIMYGVGDTNWDSSPYDSYYVEWNNVSNGYTEEGVPIRYTRDFYFKLRGEPKESE